jgi:hypothetical protein
MTEQVKDVLEYYNKIIAFTQTEQALKVIAEHIPEKTYNKLESDCRKLHDRGVLAKRRAKQSQPVVYYTALFSSYPEHLMHLIRTPRGEYVTPKYMMDKLADKYIETARLARSDRKSPRVYIGSVSGEHRVGN